MIFTVTIYVHGHNSIIAQLFIFTTRGIRLQSRFNENEKEYQPRPFQVESNNRSIFLDAKNFPAVIYSWPSVTRKGKRRDSRVPKSSYSKPKMPRTERDHFPVQTRCGNRNIPATANILLERKGQESLITYPNDVHVTKHRAKKYSWDPSIPLEESSICTFTANSNQHLITVSPRSHLLRPHCKCN